MGKEVNRNIPLAFEVVEDFDSRFQKVKIWLMHMGENYNRSFFEKEIVQMYMDTVKNTPLLGFIEEDKYGNLDFKGHEEVLIVKNGEFDTKYLGSAYGVIPESCNPRFEFKEGDDGVIREYLVVDALMWTKFDDAVEILTSNSEVSQSMELSSEYDGYWDDNNLFHFTKFKFDGACMLGRNVLPAMEKASVEMNFNINKIDNQIKNKLVEFENYINSKFSKEVKDLTVEELLAKYNLTTEDLAEKEINVENFSLEELEAVIIEKFTSEEEKEEVAEDFEKDGNEVQEDNNEEESKDLEEEKPEESEEVAEEFEAIEDSEKEVVEKFVRKFELSHEDIRTKMYKQLDGHLAKALNKNDDDYVWAYIVSVFETYIIVEEHSHDNDFYMIKYEVKDDEVSLGEVTKVFPMFLTSEEKGALELMRNSFEAYENENKELKDFKATIEKEIHSQKAEELFSQFDKLTEEDIAELRENVHNFTIEELEAKTFEILGRKVSSKYTRKDSNKNNSISIKFSQNENKSSDFDKLFIKHGFKK